MQLASTDLPAIAIVGMACRYPDANSPEEFWENILAQRRAFRRIPDERLRLEDYYSPSRDDSDFIYTTQAAVLKDFDFDRVKYRVSGDTYRQADMTHWLALDVADQAFNDAGFPDGEGLVRERTGVLLGNTLTGEFARANLMRGRWPYVRRVVDDALATEGWAPAQRQEFLTTLEANYKAPFPAVGTETLAGGLSNTIAGRICNHFDLKGGGYTVDGACASSLLAVANACAALANGDLDVALAGGVDLSLDPFELVGFARTGALAPDKMRIYDERSAGFWPGEGCGFVVLMRQEDAIAQRRRIYALIRGWGISSDGNGGITRPEVDGQILAVQRAYQRAGLDVESVTYFEGHGTGTAVGDATELRTISRARREALQQAQPTATGREPAYISSVKGSIGHTKAAAGVAGLIKTALALHHQLLPPTAGHVKTHPELMATTEQPKPMLQVSTTGQRWPADRPLHAGVSAMGFGGINSHLALTAATTRRRKGLDTHEQLLLGTPQDAELFLFSGQSNDALGRQITQLRYYAAQLAFAEQVDLAAELARQLTPGSVRAAVVARTPAELAEQLRVLQAWLERDMDEQLAIGQGVFLSRRTTVPRIGYLFPGQGTRVYLDGGLWERRFTAVRDLYRMAALQQYGYQGVETAVAQPAIITAALAGLTLLDKVGIEADVAVGHSLGELAALHWAGALDEAALLRVAAVRGKAMMDLSGDSGSTGTMAMIGAGHRKVHELVNGEVVSLACLNTPRQTVISGSPAEVATVMSRAQQQGIAARSIPVSHAFHSPLVAAAAQPLATYLATETFQPLHTRVISTITGAALPANVDLTDLLTRQITAPVRFAEAVTVAAADVDLFIEVGPGGTLTQLTGDCVDTPTIALDAGGYSLQGLLRATGAAFVLGANVHHNALFADRFHRPFDLQWQASFLANPCELAPTPPQPSPAKGGSYELADGITVPPPVWGRLAAPFEQVQPMPKGGGEISTPVTSSPPTVEDDVPVFPQNGTNAPTSTETDILTVVRQAVATKIELPLDAVGTQDRLLSDLHINSIAVTQIVAEAAQQLGIATPLAPTEFANLTVTDVAQSLADIGQQVEAAGAQRLPAGVESWVRSFAVDWIAKARPPRQVRKGKAWQLFAPDGYPLTTALESALTAAGGGGVMLCLPPENGEFHVGLLLQTARRVLAEEQHPRFVVVQHTEGHANGGAALARTLHLEAPHIPTTVVDLPLDHVKSVDWAVAEAMATAGGFTEARYDADGRRWEPMLRLMEEDGETGDGRQKTEDRRQEPFRHLGSDDVVLVTGGGKGITAECALRLAETTGVKLAIFGRSQPQADPELATNLNRMTEAGITFRYTAVDITDEAVVQAAVQGIEQALGAVTALLHGAARNVPQLLHSLSEVDFQRTLAPKVTGLRHLLAAIDPERLRLIVGFGSIIARLGLPGEADYAVANDWMASMLQRQAAAHPHCRTLTIDWSVWAGAGMGERLGTLDGLMREGITPIPLDTGVATMLRLLSQIDELPSSVVVAGRYGTPTTIHVDQPQLPFRRYLEVTRVHVPGVELVVDATLSGDNDPYLDDHVFEGERLFLAVLGLEAMAQAAMALIGATELPTFTQVQFHRPIVVPPDSEVTIRLAALRLENGDVKVVVRSAETGYQANHFEALCRFGEKALVGNKGTQKVSDDFSELQLDPDGELYRQLFFHKGRFQRVQNYRRIGAHEMIAKLTPDDGEPWFGRYLPQEFMLGDPGARDATIHALQVCVPSGTLLPVSVERIEISADTTTGMRHVHARERQAAAVGDTLIFDVTVLDETGTPVEVWQGLTLKRMDGTAYDGIWSPPVLGPYIERQLGELLPNAPAVALVRGEAATMAERQNRSTEAMQRAIGKPIKISRRADGKPTTRGKWSVSAAHAGDLTLAVAAPKATGVLGCDLEVITTRSRANWHDLLGDERLTLAEMTAHECGDAFDAAATRVWCAMEALCKAGICRDTPLTLTESTSEAWVLFVAGDCTVATYVAHVYGVDEAVVAAVVTGIAPG